MKVPPARIHSFIVAKVAVGLVFLSLSSDLKADPPDALVHSTSTNEEAEASLQVNDSIDTRISRESLAGPKRQLRHKKRNKRKRERGVKPIQLKVQGTFEMNVPGIGVVHAEGSTTMELDQSGVERLGQELARSMNDSKPGVSTVIEGILSLPSTLRTTSETLKMLGDPETQEALRQVESLLRLLPKPPTPTEARERGNDELPKR